MGIEIFWKVYLKFSERWECHESRFGNIRGNLGQDDQCSGAWHLNLIWHLYHRIASLSCVTERHFIIQGLGWRILLSMETFYCCVSDGVPGYKCSQLSRNELKRSRIGHSPMCYFTTRIVFIWRLCWPSGFKKKLWALRKEFRSGGLAQKEPSQRYCFTWTTSLYVWTIIYLPDTCSDCPASYLLISVVPSPYPFLQLRMADTPQLPDFF